MEPAMMGPVPEVVTLPCAGGEVIEVPLPKEELPGDWMPLEGVTQLIC